MKSYKWMTVRDNAIYEFLQKTRYVSTSQLSELFFTHNSEGVPIKNGKLICRRRMVTLESNLPDVQSFFWQANKDKIYSVLPPKEHIVPLSKIQHSLELNDVYIKIRSFTSKHPSNQIYDFLIEPALKNGTIPDLLLIYMINKKARIYFIEYDRGTESLAIIKKKIERYNTYFSKQLYLSEDWQPSSIKPEVIFVTNTKARVEKIKRMGVQAFTDIQLFLAFGQQMET